MDDPAGFPEVAADLTGYLRHGWDLEPRPYLLYGPDLGSGDADDVLAGLVEVTGAINDARWVI